MTATNAKLRTEQTKSVKEIRKPVPPFPRAEVLDAIHKVEAGEDLGYRDWDEFLAVFTSEEYEIIYAKYEDRKPNDETLEAMRQIEAGETKSFDTWEEFMADLNSDDDDDD